jgi:hypothetical protein
MCGRYASFLPAEAIARIFGTVNPLPNLAGLERRADVGRGSCTLLLSTDHCLLH